MFLRDSRWLLLQDHPTLNVPNKRWKDFFSFSFNRISRDDYVRIHQLQRNHHLTADVEYRTTRRPPCALVYACSQGLTMAAWAVLTFEQIGFEFVGQRVRSVPCCRLLEVLSSRACFNASLLLQTHSVTHIVRPGQRSSLSDSDLDHHEFHTWDLLSAQRSG